MNIQTVGVIGSGTMGAGIAQVVSQQGFVVRLYDIKDDIVSRAAAKIHAQWDKMTEKGRLTPEACAAAKSRLTTTAELADLHDCQLVIEAAPERIDIKQDIFRRLEQICAPDAILATNTSSLSVTSIAGSTQSPHRIAGLHFFNPAPLMPLVEVVRGLRTEEYTMELLTAFTRQIGKHPVLCQDTPGFIVNRVARPFHNEALRIMGDRLASPQQIDRIMKKAGGFRMGPFELQDMIGLDINFSATKSVYEGMFGDPRFRPHYYQLRMVESGNLGRKSGRGYYVYES
jgi:3-hydroxybutyryl-CoA dehydrogenase